MQYWDDDCGGNVGGCSAGGGGDGSRGSNGGGGGQHPWLWFRWWSMTYTCIHPHTFTGTMKS